MDDWIPPKRASELGHRGRLAVLLDLLLEGLVAGTVAAHRRPAPRSIRTPILLVGGHAAGGGEVHGRIGRRSHVGISRRSMRMVGGNAAAAVVRTDHTPTATRAVGGTIAQPALLEVDEGRQLASKLVAHRPSELLPALGRL